MTEVDYIFNTMTDRSLIIIDELCRSTSVEEATAIAMMICDKLARSKAYTFVTTHYTLLTKLADLFFNIKVWQLETIPSGDPTNPKTMKLDFKFSLVPGATTLRGYGIYMVRGIWPPNVMRRVDKLQERYKKQAKDPKFPTLDKSARLKYNLDCKVEKLKLKKKFTLANLNSIVTEYDRQMEKLGGEDNQYSQNIIQQLTQPMDETPMGLDHSIFDTSGNDNPSLEEPSKIFLENLSQSRNSEDEPQMLSPIISQNSIQAPVTSLSQVEKRMQEVFTPDSMVDISSRSSNNGYYSVNLSQNFEPEINISYNNSLCSLDITRKALELDDDGCSQDQAQRNVTSYDEIPNPRYIFKGCGNTENEISCVSQLPLKDLSQQMNMIRQQQSYHSSTDETPFFHPELPQNPPTVPESPFIRTFARPLQYDSRRTSTPLVTKIQPDTAKNLESTSTQMEDNFFKGCANVIHVSTPRFNFTIPRDVEDIASMVEDLESFAEEMKDEIECDNENVWDVACNNEDKTQEKVESKKKISKHAKQVVNEHIFPVVTNIENLDDPSSDEAINTSPNLRPVGKNHQPTDNSFCLPSRADSTISNYNEVIVPKLIGSVEKVKKTNKIDKQESQKQRRTARRSENNIALMIDAFNSLSRPKESSELDINIIQNSNNENNEDANRRYTRYDITEDVIHRSINQPKESDKNDSRDNNNALMIAAFNSLSVPRKLLSPEATAKNKENDDKNQRKVVSKKKISKDSKKIVNQHIFPVVTITEGPDDPSSEENISTTPPFEPETIVRPVVKDLQPIGDSFCLPSKADSTISTHNEAIETEKVKIAIEDNKQKPQKQYRIAKLSKDNITLMTDAFNSLSRPKKSFEPEIGIIKDSNEINEDANRTHSRYGITENVIQESINRPKESDKNDSGENNNSLSSLRKSLTLEEIIGKNKENNKDKKRQKVDYKKKISRDSKKVVNQHIFPVVTIIEGPNDPSSEEHINTPPYDLETIVRPAVKNLQPKDNFSCLPTKGISKISNHNEVFAPEFISIDKENGYVEAEKVKMTTEKQRSTAEQSRNDTALRPREYFQSKIDITKDSTNEKYKDTNKENIISDINEITENVIQESVNQLKNDYRENNTALTIEMFNSLSYPRKSVQPEIVAEDRCNKITGKQAVDQDSTNGPFSSSKESVRSPQKCDKIDGNIKHKNVKHPDTHVPNGIVTEGQDNEGTQAIEVSKTNAINIDKKSEKKYVDNSVEVDNVAIKNTNVINVEVESCEPAEAAKKDVSRTFDVEENGKKERMDENTFKNTINNEIGKPDGSTEANEVAPLDNTGIVAEAPGNKDEALKNDDVEGTEEDIYETAQSSDDFSYSPLPPNVQSKEEIPRVSTDNVTIDNYEKSILKDSQAVITTHNINKSDTIVIQAISKSRDVEVDKAKETDQFEEVTDLSNDGDDEHSSHSVVQSASNDCVFEYVHDNSRHTVLVPNTSKSSQKNNDQSYNTDFDRSTEKLRLSQRNDDSVDAFKDAEEIGQANILPEDTIRISTRRTENKAEEEIALVIEDNAEEIVRKCRSMGTEKVHKVGVNNTDNLNKEFTKKHADSSEVQVVIEDNEEILRKCSKNVDNKPAEDKIILVPDGAVEKSLNISNTIAEIQAIADSEHAMKIHRKKIENKPTEDEIIIISDEDVKKSSKISDSRSTVRTLLEDTKKVRNRSADGEININKVSKNSDGRAKTLVLKKSEFRTNSMTNDIGSYSTEVYKNVLENDIQFEEIIGNKLPTFMPIPAIEKTKEKAFITSRVSNGIVDQSSAEKCIKKQGVMVDVRPKSNSTTDAATKCQITAESLKRKIDALLNVSKKLKLSDDKGVTASDSGSSAETKEKTRETTSISEASKLRNLDGDFSSSSGDARSGKRNENEISITSLSDASRKRNLDKEDTTTASTERQSKRSTTQSNNSFSTSENEMKIQGKQQRKKIKKFTAPLKKHSTSLVRNSLSNESSSSSKSDFEFKNKSKTDSNKGQPISKFVYPSKMSQKAIKEAFFEQDKIFYESSGTSEQLAKMWEDRLKRPPRPTPKQIQQSTCLATIRKTNEGVEVIPPEKKTSKSYVRNKNVLLSRSGNTVNMNIFSDRNAKAFDEFIKSDKKDYKLFDFNFGSDRKDENDYGNTYGFQQVNTASSEYTQNSQSWTFVRKRSDEFNMTSQRSTNSNFPATNDVSLTPEGFYKQNRNDIDGLLRKYK